MAVNYDGRMHFSTLFVFVNMPSPLMSSRWTFLAFFPEYSHCFLPLASMLCAMLCTVYGSRFFALCVCYCDVGLWLFWFLVALVLPLSLSIGAYDI